MKTIYYVRSKSLEVEECEVCRRRLNLGTGGVRMFSR